MLVHEVIESQPRKKICDFHYSEVFKYGEDWFMVIEVDFNHVTGWDQFCTDNIHNPLDMDWNYDELTACIALEHGAFCFLGDHWYADDYGIAETRITVKSRS